MLPRPVKGLGSNHSGYATAAGGHVQLFIDILNTVTLPIIALVALGWAAQTRLSLAVETLNKLLVQIILPCFFVHYLSTAELPLLAVWPTAWFTPVQFVLLLGIGWLIAGLAGISREAKPVVAIALAFPNTGNFGLPVVHLAFPPDFLLHQAIIVAEQSVLIIIACTILLPAAGQARANPLMSLAKSPMIWGITAGLGLKASGLALPVQLANPIELMSATYAAMALFTLGAGLGSSGVQIAGRALVLATVLKLGLAPALTWAMAAAAGFSGAYLDLLVVASAAPVGVLLAIFAQQARNGATLSASAVFITTVLSPVAVTAWIMATRLY